MSEASAKPVERWKFHEYDVDLESLIIIPKGDGYSRIRVQPTITPVLGETYNLLVVSYTTGDSNGRCAETQYECVDLYSDRDQAHEMALRIRKDLEHDTFFNRHRKGFKPEKLVIGWACGSEETNNYWPWKGYFEQVEEIAVYEVTYAQNPRKVTF